MGHRTTYQIHVGLFIACFVANLKPCGSRLSTRFAGFNSSLHLPDLPGKYCQNGLLLIIARIQNKTATNSVLIDNTTLWPNISHAPEFSAYPHRVPIFRVASVSYFKIIKHLFNQQISLASGRPLVALTNTKYGFCLVKNLCCLLIVSKEFRHIKEIESSL